jgi:hypothetical protein
VPTNRPTAHRRNHLTKRRGLAMKKDHEIVRIDLTPEQKQILKQEIGKDGEAVELTVNELEERIAPRMIV